MAVYQGETKEAISDGYFHEGEIGYVGAYNYADVSGYTAFFLGVRAFTPMSRWRVMYIDVCPAHRWHHRGR